MGILTSDTFWFLFCVTYIQKTLVWQAAGMKWNQISLNYSLGKLQKKHKEKDYQCLRYIYIYDTWFSAVQEWLYWKLTGHVVFLRDLQMLHLLSYAAHFQSRQMIHHISFPPWLCQFKWLSNQPLDCQL